MITVILGSCFLLIDWLSFGYSEWERERGGGGGGGGSREIERRRSRGWKNFGSLSFFFLSFGEGESDENDDSNFEILLHFYADIVAE